MIALLIYFFDIYSLHIEAIICGENIAASNGNISSPNYPESYSNDLFCVWKVSVFMGYTIVLDFLSVDTENSTDCLYDYIEVFI